MADGKKPGRNDPCACGSRRKFKVCCGAAPQPLPLPGPAASAVAQANQRLRAGDYAGAIPLLSRAARLAPSSADVANDLGMALLITGNVGDATRFLTRAVELRPGAATMHYNLGLALEQGGARDAALAAYREATARDPKLAAAHSHTAELLVQRGVPREAAAAYERAAAAKSGTPFALLSLAKARILLDRPTEAEAQLRELLARDTSHAEARVLLGTTLSEAGRFEEAGQCFEAALGASPWQAAAYHGLVSSRRLGASDAGLVARLVAETRAPSRGDRQAMTLHFAAGKALDDRGDYEGAMSQLSAANRARRRLARPFRRDDLRQLVDRMLARFQPGLFSTTPPLGVAGSSDDRPVLVLGMPRSGTTLIERILSAHPSVAGGGELPFWNERAGLLADGDGGADKLRTAAAAAEADYRKLLTGIAPDALRITDKMPFNFLWIGVVHLLFPRARFVHCRRNPIDTCLSIYSTLFAQPWGFASDLGDLAAYYREYRRLMDHWRAVIPPAQLIEVDYEDVIRAPEEAARRLVDFAALPWDAACASPEKNGRAVRTASKWQARQPIYSTSVERWRRYEPWLGELRDLVDA